MRMKVIFAAFISLTFCVPAAIPRQGTFAVYLIAGSPDARDLARNPSRWKELALSSAPVISDVDIVSYDFSKHAMRLRPEAIKRLPKPPVEGTPFVVVVNGERIYLGAFYTNVSSIPFVLPVIVVDSAERHQAREQGFLFIERAYPVSHAVGVDARSDERIKSVLSTLKKLASLNK